MPAQSRKRKTRRTKKIARCASPMDRLVAIMNRLRSPGGCPWDREQTVESLKPYLVEECYEVLEAIDQGNPSKHAEELGDVLLQIVFQAQIASEGGKFDFNDVARTVGDKLIRRHPHVFGNVKVSGSKEVLRNWEAIKRLEKGGQLESAIGKIPRHLPALHRAQQVQKKVARVGFDWDAVHGVLDKIEEELREVKHALTENNPRKVRDEIGDLLFAVVNLSRFLGHSAEEALDRTISKFVRRFQEIERRLRAQGRKVTDCTLGELDAIWNRIKKREIKSRTNNK